MEGKTNELVPDTQTDFGYNYLRRVIKPFSKVVWEGSKFLNDQEVGAIFEYLSKGGEEGCSVNLSCRVIYSLNNKNEFKIINKATADQKTIINMTDHSYFNLV